MSYCLVPNLLKMKLHLKNIDFYVTQFIIKRPVQLISFRPLRVSTHL